MNKWQDLEKQYYVQVVGRFPVTLVRGEGTRVWDDDGKSYLDFLGGIATNALGHCHPVVVKAITDQANTLMHVTNWFFSVPQVQLAEILVNNSCMDRVFFCNSGAEANEGAIKLARKYGKVKKGGAYEIISTWHSFHGRTMATLAATGKQSHHDPVEPIPIGFPIVDYNDLNAIKAATNERTIAVMLEIIQGEGGVYVASFEYLKGVSDWCKENGMLLILDEVQTGMGRTGSMWGYQQCGIEPDIMTSAKALAGGFPIGALMAKEEASVFSPGDHGSTFGGNPLACATGYAVTKYIIDNDLPGNAKKVGEYFQSKLKELQGKHGIISEVRGRGLLIGVELNRDVAIGVVNEALKEGLIANYTDARTLRFMPPLVIGPAEVDEAVSIVDKAMSKVLATVS